MVRAFRRWPSRDAAARVAVAWIESARREETRLRRLDEAIRLLAGGKVLGLKWQEHARAGRRLAELRGVARSTLEYAARGSRPKRMHANKDHALCIWMSALAISVGATGMVVSFGFLASCSFEEITAGMSGFVAGAILIGSGLVALALLTRQATPTRPEDSGNRATMPLD